ncbi:hypothetical protein ABZY14_36870 [Streptomyces sp. NPDC006617]|uniref:4'-phosphopantetheinyl transferase family protein n=1 Tax=Streptomyces sp. NPDC006617 TaxID=3155354 RepID=UPI0033BAFBC2
MAPPPGLVHVWCVPLSGQAADDSLAAAGQVLDADEAARPGRLVLREDRRRWTAARVALRTLLAGYLGVAPGRITRSTGRAANPGCPARGPTGRGSA